MQSVLGTSAALGFQLDLGELQDILLYPIALYLGKTYEFRGHLTYLSSMPVQSLLVSPTAVKN